jgi:predicted ATPase
MGAGVRVLATSQEPLGVADEHVFRLSPLGLPCGDDLDDPLRHPAIRLFVERLQAAVPGFILDEHSARVTADICRRLDGMPLAIELAASRAAALGIHEVAAGLEHGFRLLAGGWRTSLPRHRSLEATFAWSYRLLPPAHRPLACRLATRPAGFPLEAARAVAGKSLGPAALAEIVASLVAKSLLVADHCGPAPRYRFTETMRAFFLEMLAED